eukprot:2012819-Amphidinium_carterae.1
MVLGVWGVVWGREFLSSSRLFWGLGNLAQVGHRKVVKKAEAHNSGNRTFPRQKSNPQAEAAHCTASGNF